MSSNVGLSTPRGSGTSGYVQRNLSHLKPRDAAAPYNLDDRKHRQRKPDPEILEHERKRKIEAEVFELRDKLEEEGVDEDEIDDRCDALRKELEEQSQASRGKTDARALKGYQVHDLAKAKIEETEKLRRALGIRDDYEEGSHWKRQEQRLRDTLSDKARTETDATSMKQEASKSRDGRRRRSESYED